MLRLLLILLLSSFAILHSAFSAQPNILFILTEDQGAHMSALGRTDIQTPNMDSLAASGALFRRAYVAYPVCSASKACIMTGLHSHTNGLVNNTNNFFKRAEKLTDAEKKTPPYLHTRIRSAAPTLVEVLVQAGYHAAVSGKLHVSPNERFPYHDFIPKVPAKQALTSVIKRAAGKPWFFLHNSTTFTHRPFVNSEKQPITIDPAKVLKQLNWKHLLTDNPRMLASCELHRIQGRRRTWFCGEYTTAGYGHEFSFTGLGEIPSDYPFAVLTYEDPRSGLYGSQRARVVSIMGWVVTRQQSVLRITNTVDISDGSKYFYKGAAVLD